MLSPFDQLIYDATRGLADAPPGAHLIPLTKSLFAVVDDEDFGRIASARWCALTKRDGAKPYAIRHERGHDLRMHRVILGVPHGVLVDHKSGNGLDNRRSNIRACTRWENAVNRGLRSDSGNKFKGIYPRLGRYRALLTFNGRNYAFGTHDTPEEAARAYDVAAKQFFGEFARLNFPDHMDTRS